MAFSFNSPAPGPGAPAPAASGTSQTSASTAQRGGFGFGGTANAPAASAPAPTTATFGFGATSNAPTASTTTPAPATTFGFGGTSSATSTSTAPAPATSFGFGSAASTPAPPAAATPPSTLTVPSYNELFPGRLIWDKIGGLLQTAARASETEEAVLAGQELIYLLNQKDSTIVKHLLQPNSAVSAQQQADQALRQRLMQNPMVTLSILREDDDSIKEQDGVLTPKMLQEVFALADDLQISEAAAICLYQEACCQTAPFRSKLARNYLKQSMVQPADTVAWTARELYVAQRSLLVRTCLLLLQNRLQEGGERVCEATDALLQSGWIENLNQAVLGYTQQIEHILNVMRAEQQPNTADSGQFWRYDVMLQCLVLERQITAECLFFTAYHVQLKGAEVGALIDLVRDLTNRQLLLNPYTDVPDPYDEVGGAPMYGYTPQVPFFHQVQKKNPLVWQRELVTSAWKTGQPDLVRCSSTLIVAVVSALGDRAALMDRYTHKANTFGVGNALLPPGATSTENLAPIHSRLSGDSNMEWQRRDVLGLLKSSYAMLLRSSRAGFSSPRGTGVFPRNASQGGTIDVRKTWRECIESPAELKSFTFARLTLIPALEKPPSSSIEDYNNLATAESCNVAEFFLSVLTEFSSHYLDVLSSSGDRPISRKKWEEDAEADLRLRRSHQEQQRDFQGQFRAYAGRDAAFAINDVPAAVDLYERPDCMDDVVAFSTAVCSRGPEYALSFWSQEVHIDGDEEGDVLQEYVKLVPSRALRELDSQQKDDDTLRPCYLSFLAALALAENPTGGPSGAAVVHEMLSGGTSSQVHQDWSSLIEILRWYVRQLDPQGYSRGKSSTTASTGVSTAGSTAYYYFNQPAESNAYGSNERSTNEDASSRSGPRELGEENTYILLSHLAIISNVAKKSPAARSAIVSINLPIQSTDGSDIIGQDSTLMILFTLAVMPLSPEVRGTVFTTIARLLSVEGASTEEAAIIEQAAAKGWELLEACLVVPITMLEQYSSGQDTSIPSSSGLSFPPSSTAMASNRNENSWVPADPRFAIVYEMEYIEFSLGHYPSSEGFLKLIASLFKVGGCPWDLGKNWRVRTGCSPYIEYVIDYLLPRAKGRFANLPPLPFRSSEDQSRLVAIALEVVQAVLFRYTVPPKVMSRETSPERLAAIFQKATQKDAYRVLGNTQLAKEVALAPHTADVMPSTEDFLAKPSFPSQEKTEAKVSIEYQGATKGSAANSSLPRSKSPGYTILAEMLSGLRCSLFTSLISIVVDRTDTSGFEIDSDSFALAYALYASTPPTFSSAIEGAKGDVPAISRQFLIAPLRPALEDSIHCLGFSFWRDQAILDVLQILCASLAREESFQRRVDSAPGQTSFVPVLKFQKKSLVPMTVDLQLTKISHLLISSDSREKVLSSIIDLIGFVSSNEKVDAEIAIAASSLVFNVARNLPQQQIDDIIVREGSRHGRIRLSFAFEKRFLVASARTFCQANCELIRLLLNQVLLDLRTDSSIGDSLAHAILGLPISTFSRGQSIRDLQDSGDGLDSLLQLVDVNEFVFGANCADLASCCYEILYRLTLLKPGHGDMNCVLYTAERLRMLDFWRSHLSKIFRSNLSNSHFSVIENSHVFHSIAWLLKGAASELYLLAGFPHGINAAPDQLKNLIVPLPSCYKNLSEALFSVEGVIDHALRVLPIRRPLFESMATVPPEQAVKGAKETIAGAPEVVAGYETVNEKKLIEATKSYVSEDDCRVWAEQWNRSVVADCASAHMSDAIHVVLGASVCSSKFAVFQLPPGSTPGYKLLVHIMECMTLESNPNKSSQLLDKVFFTTACRNLALAALMASSSASTVSYDTSPSETSVDTVVACNLMARAIACSGGNEVGPDGIRRNERVAVLACALLLVLRDLPDHQLRDGDQYQMLQAALVLSKLASSVSGNQFPVVPSAEALAARSCLSVLLEILESSWPKNEILCSHAVLTDATATGSSTSPIVAMIQLIPLLDGNIATLLQKICEFPRTADLLIECGILEALQVAGERYREEEAKFLASQAYSVQYGQGHAQIATPPFLRSHLDLMGALISSKISANRVLDVASKIISVIRCYDSVNERLLGSFPLDGDALHDLWRCLAQTNALLYSTNNSGILSTIAEHHRLTAEMGEPYLRKVAMLTMHIAENPLPSRFLGLIPSRLRPIADTPLVSGVVATATSGENCWWDTLDTGSETKRSAFVGAPDLSIEDDICDFALLGADLSRYGLSLIRGSSSVVACLDEYTLSRALWRCVDAANRIGSYLASLHTRQSGGQSAVQNKLVELRSKLTASLVELLLICISRVREVKKDQYVIAGNSVDSFCKTISFTLDHIESLGSIGEDSGDENNLDYARGIAELLKKELQ